MAVVLSVVVPTPAHSSLAGPLSYASELPLAPGTLVRVPLGRREVCGVVWDGTPEAPSGALAAAIRPISGVLDGMPPLVFSWRQLVTFASSYYQRSLGEVALAALPPQLRDLDAGQLARRLKRKSAAPDAGEVLQGAPALTAEQQQALAAIEGGAGPFLLFGATGSGKTEVYLHAVADV